MLVRRFQNSNHMKAEAAVFAKGQRFLSRMPGGMSAYGTQQTLPWCPRISAFEGKADIRKAESNGPIYEHTP